MDYYDGRFSNHSRFPYYAYNSLARWDALNCGNVFVRLNGFEGMTAEDIAVQMGNPAHDIANSIMYYGANLRGTRSYWKQRCTELIQMVRQLGTPAIFFTLSAADYHWPDLFRILAGTEFIDERRRRSLMHDNPATVAWFFEKRCELFMKHFMNVFFNVDDYWYRFEWQHRGSPHIHGLLWLADAPNCSDIGSLNEEQRQEIIDYFDALVSASIESVIPVPISSNPCRLRLMDLQEHEKESDLDKLLTAVQRHKRCGSHCMRKKRGQGRQLHCRFRFPMQLEESSSLRHEESGAWTFIPKRNDPLLERYNQYVTRVWRGNTDFTPITSNDAVINYISKYASKGEYSSGAFSDILKTLVTRAHPTTPAVTIVRQLLISSVGERNYSAQEVHHLLMGWSLFHCSRSIIILSLKEEWQRYGARNNSTFLAHYSRRDRELDNITLFEFAKTYRFSGTRMIRRRQECIVRVIPFIKEPDASEPNHEYFMLQCKLNIPWRGTFEHIKPPEFTWRDLYIQNVNQIERADEFAREFPHVADDFELDDFPDVAAYVVRDPGMAAARIQPGSLRSDEVGMRPIVEAFSWHDFQTAGLTNDEIDSYLRSFKTSEPHQSDRQPIVNYSLMSSEQRRVVDIVRSQIEGTNNTKRIIVQGKAGTGKSAVISFICERLETCLGSDSYQVLAPTGAAALNVGGKTIHSYLRIPANSQLAPLNGINLRSFQLQFKNLRYLLIDEYSMIGLRMLHKIHKRLCEARGSQLECFGGYNIILFGDLRQLPPVKDTAIYMDAFSEFSKELIQSFQARVVLSTCFRQGHGQNRFREMLDNIAKGSASRDDWNLLNSRRSILHTLDNFSSAVRLFSTNAQVRAFNEQVLSSNGQPVAIINAWHNNPTARQGTDDQAHGLARTLKLSIGSRIMLRKNISVKHGLVNGSIGKLIDIVYNTGDRPLYLPYALLIEFDQFKGPYLKNRLFPILPMVSTWKDQSVDCTRKQFPINLADAITIHKSQGLTLNKVIVDIGEKELAAGCTYVALSRVKKMEDLILANYCDETRLTSLGQMLHLRRREEYLSNF